MGSKTKAFRVRWPCFAAGQRGARPIAVYVIVRGRRPLYQTRTADPAGEHTEKARMIRDFHRV